MRAQLRRANDLNAYYDYQERAEDEDYANPIEKRPQGGR